MRVRSRECCTYFYTAMKVIGWSIPTDQGWRRYLYLFWSFLSTGLVAVYLPIGFFLSLVKDFGNISTEDTLIVLQVSSDVIGQCAKILIFLKLVSRVQQTLLVLDTLDDHLRSESDRCIIHKAVARCNFIVVLYMFVYLAYPGFAFMAGIFTNKPPYMIYNPLFDWRDSRFLLWMQSMIENFIMGMAVTVGIVLDTYTLIFVTMFRAHFKVLKERIRILRSDPLKSEADNYEDLVGCILYQDRKSVV